MVVLVLRFSSKSRKPSYMGFLFCYNCGMETKILIMGVITNGDKILMRKKPDGSPPYKETWYIFGGELTTGITPEEAIVEQVKKQTSININFIKPLGWDTETKKDLDGIEKRFVYLDCLCEYVTGELKPTEDIERLEWVKINNLKNYDIVPPSKILFKKLGYL